MRIRCIDNIQQFDELKGVWDFVYSSDPHAKIFVAWAWLRGWFEVTPHKWLILAFAPGDTSSYVAFLPLSIDAATGRLQMGGNPVAAHTGFLCIPEYEKQAISAFAAFVQQELKWRIFQMSQVSDPRLDLFIRYFKKWKFPITATSSTSLTHISLPDTWEQYLQNFLRKNTRKKLRRGLRSLNRQNEFSITQLQAENVEYQIETIIKLWQLRWGQRTGEAFQLRSIFRHCLECNSIWLAILWHGTTAVAGDLAFVDKQKGVFSTCIGGYDSRYNNMSPGISLTGYSIRYAIENGFKVYDFLTGNEQYKLSFGAVETINPSHTITRRSLRSASKQLRLRLKKYLSFAFLV